MAGNGNNNGAILISLTTDQFQAALARHVDASKPDPLVKAQLENIQLSWEQHHEDGVIPHHQPGDDDPLQTFIICGTLALTSEYISILIHVNCKCKMNSTEGKETPATKEDNCNISSSSILQTDTNIIPDKSFENDLYIQLTTRAKMVSLNEYNAAANNNKEDKKKLLDRKEIKARRNLRARMVQRLKSDKSIQRLLMDDDADNNNGRGKSSTTNDNDQNVMDPVTQTDIPTEDNRGLPLCEALIQQNPTNGELEERVDVNENALDAIRTAIFSHCEDNLDVLEILLNMPYLPRKNSGNSNVGGSSEHYFKMTNFNSLAERAYLRLLEDAMFDACEKEGEDEMLDDLNLHDANNYEDDSGGSNNNATEGRGKNVNGKKKVIQSKRVKPTSTI